MSGSNRECDVTVISVKNKRQKTGDNKVIEIEKQTLINLIAIKDDSITYSSINSSQEYFKNFKRVLINKKESEYIKCDNCSVLVKCTSKIGNSTASRHKCDNQMKSQPKIEKHFVKTIKNKDKIKSELADSIALCVAKDLRPINMIEGQGFRDLAQKLVNIGSRYPNISINDLMPSMKTIRNHISIVYESIKTKLVERLSNIECLGITSDHWEHESTKTNYLSITAQYLKDSELFCNVLATIPVEDKTAVLTRNEITKVFIDFNLSPKFTYFVSDNARAMIAAFKEDEWFSCAAHNINLVHKHTFKLMNETIPVNSIQSLINNAKELVRYFKHSGNQKLLDITLKQSVDVRWDSTLLMLESIKTNYNKIKELSVDNQRINQMFVNINESLLNELIALLKPLYELRVNLCKESEPTFHLILPTKHKMLNICEPKTCDSEIIEKLKIYYRKNIEEYFKIKDLHFVGAMLYPPIKNLNNLATIEQKSRTIELLQKLIENFEIERKESSQTVDNVIELDLCFDGFTDTAQSSQTLTYDENEIKSYLNSNDSFTSKSITKFWSENKAKYPRLYLLSNRLSSIPATSLSSERNFSFIGLTLTDRRSRIEPNNVNKLLFIRSNYNLYANN
jgi:hypothetical protein